MMRMDPKEVFRWLLVPLAAVAGFAVSILLAYVVNGLLSSLVEWAGFAIYGKDRFERILLPVDGALAAALVILMGAWAAPRYRMATALCLLCIGGVFAWSLVGDFQSWEFSPHGPIRVWQPIIGTYTGGVIACVLVHFIFRTAQKPRRDEPGSLVMTR